MLTVSLYKSRSTSANDDAMFHLTVLRCLVGSGAWGRGLPGGVMEIREADLLVKFGLVQNVLRSKSFTLIFIFVWKTDDFSVVNSRSYIT